jgi:transposase
MRAARNPGRSKVFLEGTRSYGVGLARALAAAGYPVFEVEPIRRGERRTGKSDAIDAHLIALHGLRMDTTRLPEPRADGDREALRILLGARDELNATRTEQINRLRHLLLSGDDADRRLARGRLSQRCCPASPNDRNRSSRPGTGRLGGPSCAGWRARFWSPISS